MFQLTRPCGSRPHCFAISNPILAFQLTRPCGSRRVVQRRQCAGKVVSTHATLRVATASHHLLLLRGRCFNSRDPAGRDFDRGRSHAHQLSFNSRDPAGRDQVCRGEIDGFGRFNSRDPAGRDLKTLCKDLWEAVSTHATLRVATKWDLLDQASRYVSTHATLRVATSVNPAHVRAIWFQLTRPCGSRRPCDPKYPRRLFVSTHATLRVATNCAVTDRAPKLVSTHATLRVATRFWRGLRFGTTVSTHATLRVATPTIQHTRCTSCVSTHATLRVATHCFAISNPILAFQLTRPCGSRLLEVGDIVTLTYVSTHATLRVATRYRSPLYRYMVVSTHATLRVATVAALG